MANSPQRQARKAHESYQRYSRLGIDPSVSVPTSLLKALIMLMDRVEVLETQVKELQHERN